MRGIFIINNSKTIKWWCQWPTAAELTYDESRESPVDPSTNENHGQDIGQVSLHHVCQHAGVWNKYTIYFLSFIRNPPPKKNPTTSTTQQKHSGKMHITAPLPITYFLELHVTKPQIWKHMGAIWRQYKLCKVWTCQMTLFIYIHKPVPVMGFLGTTFLLTFLKKPVSVLLK